MNTDQYCIGRPRLICIHRHFTICSMARVVNFIECILMMAISVWVQGQTPICEGKFILADSTVFWITTGPILRENFHVSDRESHLSTNRNDTISLNTLRLEEAIGMYTLVSEPDLGKICTKAFRRKSTSTFIKGKKRISVHIHLNAMDLEIWNVSFLLPKNNNVTLEELATIRHAIYKHYKPRVVSETKLYLNYGYLSDYASIFYDEDE